MRATALKTFSEFDCMTGPLVLLCCVCLPCTCPSLAYLPKESCALFMCDVASLAGSQMFYGGFLTQLCRVSHAYAVGDKDKIRLHTVEYESPESSGTYTQRCMQSAKQLAAGSELCVGASRSCLSCLPAMQLLPSGHGSGRQLRILLKIPTTVHDSEWKNLLPHLYECLSCCAMLYACRRHLPQWREQHIR